MYKQQLAIIKTLPVSAEITEAIVALEDNLAQEYRFGSTETLRNNRAQLINKLNIYLLTVNKPAFIDLGAN